MLKPKQRKEALPFHMVDGERVLTLTHHVSAERRIETVETPGQAAPLVSEEEDASLENADAGDADPGAGASNLVTQDWRLISAVMATPSNRWGMYLLVDYGHENGKVIRQAVSMVNKKKPDLMKDHSTSIDAVIGHVDKARWENSSDMPSGVNGTLVVDPELFPVEAKRLEKGGIYRSGSIGITANMKKSHEDMDDWDFIEKQGEKVNGEIVRLIPTKLVSVDHMAIIPHGMGADPNAGVRNVKLRNVSSQHISHGGHNMDQLEMLNSLLKLNATFVDGEPPEGFWEKAAEKISALNKAFGELATIKDRLDKLTGDLKHSDEPSLTTSEILDRLPERMTAAKNGDRYLVTEKAAALKAFDSAKVDPEKAELSDLDKRMRARIENSTDVEFVEEQHAHWAEVVKERLKTENRSSIAEELPNVDGKGKAKPVVNPDIKASVSKMFPGMGGKK